jgi:ATP-dependent Clp protease ATP-binding subunit ClpC
MYENYTPDARKAMDVAEQEARRLGHEYVGTEHILLGVIKIGSGLAAQVLKELQAEPERVQQEIEKTVGSVHGEAPVGKLPFTPRTRKVLEYAVEEARGLGQEKVGTEALLLGLVREEEAVAAQVLANLGLTREKIAVRLMHALGRPYAVPKPPSAGKPRQPTLERFGLDLTALAKQKKLSPLMDREAELEAIQIVLTCRSQNNPILLGEPGVGKRALVRGLAQQRLIGPNWNWRLVAISLDQMIASTQNAAEFREALKAVLSEVRADGQILLFLDSLAPVALPRTEEAFHLACLLRAALSRNEARTITVATPQGYQATVASDVILGRHFRPITVLPLGRAETIAILRAQKSIYEAQHRVRIADDAVETAVDLADHYLTDRVLPGKALQVVDEAGAMLRLRYLQQAPENLFNLEAEIETLDRERDTAVSIQDFEQARRLRDQIDQLKERHQAALLRWREESKQNTGLVDRQAIAEVIGRMTGKTIAPPG